MWGIGDNIHQRAVLREIRKEHEVWLETTAPTIFHDLVASGMKLVRHPGRKRIREDTSIWELSRVPANARFGRITYEPDTIKRHGSILAAQFASVGLAMPARPDFSLPVPLEWKELTRDILAQNKAGKPLLVYRPICLNKLWECPARAPDPLAYAKLYAAIRDKFFVVSVCDLTQQERIVGKPADVDVRLHKGELTFEGLAGLFAQADMVFANPGFAPVLAQAVGTTVVIVYGGNECYADTNIVGEHLAPTLAIEPDKPCPCHSKTHKCDKHITLKPHIKRLGEFVDAALHKPRTLVFATTYIDTPERKRLTEQWIEFHGKLNPDCDFLLVDSNSPLGIPEGVEVYDFGDNIGHLSRNGPYGPSSGGRDGWGRAFCKGLELAIERGYDYAVHIEGDSLFKLSVMPIVQRMRREGTKVLSTPVEGTRRKEVGWVETGLMFFDTKFVAETAFIEQYDWPNRQVRPTPEKVIFHILGDNLTMAAHWRAERGDKSQITADNVHMLDWVTHIRDPRIYDSFIAGPSVTKPDLTGHVELRLVKVNLGCGTNKLDGWQNYDSDLDISRPLRFSDNSIDFLLCEHCVEHIDYYKAIDFFKECKRVLKPGGVARIIVPSIEQISACNNQEYFNFTTRWQKLGANVRGAMHAILYAHGHKTAWTGSLLLATLFYAGFELMERCEPGTSNHAELRNVDGHAKVIGKTFNDIESLVVEAIA